MHKYFAQFWRQLRGGLAYSRSGKLQIIYRFPPPRYRKSLTLLVCWAWCMRWESWVNDSLLGARILNNYLANLVYWIPPASMNVFVRLMLCRCYSNNIDQFIVRTPFYRARGPAYATRVYRHSFWLNDNSRLPVWYNKKSLIGVLGEADRSIWVVRPSSQLTHQSTSLPLETRQFLSTHDYNNNTE